MCVAADGPSTDATTRPSPNLASHVADYGHPLARAPSPPGPPGSPVGHLDQPSHPAPRSHRVRTATPSSSGSPGTPEEPHSPGAAWVHGSPSEPRRISWSPRDQRLATAFPVACRIRLFHLLPHSWVHEPTTPRKPHVRELVPAMTPQPPDSTEPRSAHGHELTSARFSRRRLQVHESACRTEPGETGDGYRWQAPVPAGMGCVVSVRGRTPINSVRTGPSSHASHHRAMLAPSLGISSRQDQWPGFRPFLWRPLFGCSQRGRAILGRRCWKVRRPLCGGALLTDRPRAAREFSPQEHRPGPSLVVRPRCLLQGRSGRGVPG